METVASLPTRVPCPAAQERARIAHLRELRILDTPRDLVFDRFVLQAARLFETPVATLAFIDGQRHWFKSTIGMAGGPAARGTALCARTILSDELLVIPDIARDPRTALNGPVLDLPHFRFYAGAPLIVPGGYRIGTLCALDYQPRTVTPHQAAGLVQLAACVVQALSLRQHRLNGRINPLAGTRDCAESRLGSL